MSLLQLYVDDFVVKQFLFVNRLTFVFTEVESLENIRLVKVGVVQLRLVSFVVLLTFDHFLYLHDAFSLLKCFGPFTLCLASRRYHE